ncbi:MAG TPA: glucose 1-dehydrogenase [Burkholderiales bacterium]|nr:glucose 1-dehydrogenase [Burkholderiales bacterium]
MGKLDGRSAVITGGASGIGAAAARLFVREGCRVLIADIQEDKGERLANELGASAAYLRTDVSEESAVRAALEAAVARCGRLDCVFNNAGLGGVAGPIADTPLDAYERTMAVLLRGVFLGMKHAAEIMQRQHSGSIINTASVAGLQAGYGPHVYSAAKAAVIQLTRSVAMELAESGVRVNCICPGPVATPIFAGAAGLSPEVADEAVETLRRVLANYQPIRRAGLPEDIAQAALWLASDDSSFVTGQALTVDGGLTAGQPWSLTQKHSRLLRLALGAEPEGGAK